MARSRAQLALSTRLMNVGIATLCRGGSLDRAESVLVDAIRLSLPPDVVTYNTLLAAHCRVAGLNAGLAVVHRMREAGVSPDAVTYYSLIAGAARRGLTASPPTRGATTRSCTACSGLATQRMPTGCSRI